MKMTTENSSPGTVRRSRGSAWPATLTLLVLVCSGSAGAQDIAEIFAPFGELLASSVDSGQVDYPAFATSTGFADMIAALASTAPARDASREQRLAFYINSYNAVSIQGILDGYSPSSVWSRIRFFKRRKYDLFNTSISLYDLEHERIISEGDPRIHFAIVCSSKSCPPLIGELYLPDTLDAQLDSVTRGFINNPSSNTFDPTARRAQLSRIFDWYEDEFSRTAGSLQAYLATYVNDDALRSSLQDDAWSIDFRDYDWSLNGIPLSN